MSHTSCVYYSYPLDCGGDSSSDKDLHAPFRITTAEEPPDEDPGPRPLLQVNYNERRHRPWSYYQC